MTSAFLIVKTLSLAALFGTAIALFLLVVACSGALWARALRSRLAKHYLWLGLLVSATATTGSLLFSGVIGFEPCYLCWYQRLLVYPQVMIFAVALYMKDARAYAYSIALSVFGAVLASYHTYLQFGGVSPLPCPATGPDCTIRPVFEWGLVTIPGMALVTFVILILLGVIAAREWRV